MDKQIRRQYKLAAGIGLYKSKQVILDEYEMEYWDIHILPSDLIIIADLRKD